MTTLNTALGSRSLSIKDNINASTDPGAGNDSTQGYVVGSFWQNSITGRVWVARSVSVSAAVWTMLGFSDHPGYLANNWYLPSYVGIINSGTAPGAGSIRAFPAYIRERITISNLGLRVTTLSAGGNVQAAIYAGNPATGRPTGNAIISTTSMSTASAASVNAAASVQLEPGLYWFATNCDNGTAAFDALTSTSPYVGYLIGSATQANVLNASGGGMVGVAVAQTFGTWPNLTAASFTEVTTAATVPMLQFQVASAP